MDEKISITRLRLLLGLSFVFLAGFLTGLAIK